MNEQEYKIKGWVARNRNRELCLFANKPEYKLYIGWVDEHQHWRVINKRFFPELKFGDEPIEVELTIKKI